jgi:glycosyltransferase involved in cell wall biosynthesis
VLKGVVPGIGENDKVALWGGGIWNWFDPLTVIRGVARLDRPDLKLFFLGTQHPNPGIPAMRMHAQAIALADELGLRGTTVFFNEGWVPHEKRGGYFLEADVGVSAHFDDLESHFAFRTRLLDCFWAGLPVVTTVGDTLSELVRERVVGRVVDFQDVDGYAEALAAMLDCDRSSLVADFQRLRDELAWSRVVGTLVQLLEAKQDETPQPPRRTAPISARYVLARVRYALETRGIVGTGKRLVSGPARRMRGDRAAHPPPTDSRTRRRHSS